MSPARLPCPCWMLVLLLPITLLPITAIARPASYALDPVHTRVLFAVSHAGFSQAMGTVSGSTGTLVFDPDDWSTAQLQVSVPIARFDLGDDKWNHAVGARNLLDIQAHPVATFKSTRITPKDPTHATVCGTLQLRGIEHEACLDVTFNQLKRHPMPPFRRTIGFSATGQLSRKDFGITAWPSVIGDGVALRIEAEAVRSGRVDAADASGSDAASKDAAGNEATSDDAGMPAPEPVQPAEPPVEPDAPDPASTTTPMPPPTPAPTTP